MLKFASFMLYLVLSLYSLSASCVTITPLLVPAQPLGAKDLAVIINDADSLSVSIGNYYQQQRDVPPEQIIHIRFSPNIAILSKHEFEKLKQQVDVQTPKHIQAYLLTWLMPFRVECMSITTAFAAGYDPAFCSSGCVETRKSPYYSSETNKPYNTYKWRPTMALGGNNFNEVKQIIDNGITSDYSHPKGAAYLLKTSDATRSSRAVNFPDIVEKFESYWPVNYLEQDYIAGRKDVMFYFTGAIHVSHLEENRYLPGAVADHLTSTGGVMSGNNQMNIMEWLRAGVTASYGAVIEPCNFPVKFSNPALLMYFYLRGSSVIEAYWKSVYEPGQGIFVGDPLAKPFAYAVSK